MSFWLASNIDWSSNRHYRENVGIIYGIWKHDVGIEEDSIARSPGPCIPLLEPESPALFFPRV